MSFSIIAASAIFSKIIVISLMDFPFLIMSINIFYNTLISSGNHSVSGGSTDRRDNIGGAGGAGTYNIGSISTGTYIAN